MRVRPNSVQCYDCAEYDIFRTLFSKPVRAITFGNFEIVESTINF